MDGQPQVFDPLRQKWVALQPEEWVRQNMIAWLLQERKIPAALIAVEKAVSAEPQARRFDLLVHDSQLQPWMIIECKAPEVKLSEKVLMQLLSYNLKVPAPYLMITNGTFSFVANKKAEQPVWCSAFPDHPIMN